MFLIYLNKHWNKNISLGVFKIMKKNNMNEIKNNLNNRITIIFEKDYFLLKREGSTTNSFIEKSVFKVNLHIAPVLPGSIAIISFILSFF